MQSYRLRLRRKRLLWRAWRKGFGLAPIADRTSAIRPGAVLLFTCFRNEALRLPYFLSYYRARGVSHFLMVDNGSTDGGAAYAAGAEDVSLWQAAGRYSAARYGMDWLGALLARHGTGHWCLTVDPDEFLVYPFCDTRPLPALCDWLDDLGQRAFAAQLLDMYPEGPLGQAVLAEGEDPFQKARHFDAGNYQIRRNPTLGNLWIQGGPRGRLLFAEDPAHQPALNKIPLVKWTRGFAYVSSTHMLLPRGLNRVYEEWGGEKASGCLLHAKFFDGLAAKTAEELQRGEHHGQSREYRAYARALAEGQSFWNRASETYVNWRQLEILGLMSKGNWA